MRVTVPSTLLSCRFVVCRLFAILLVGCSAVTVSRPPRANLEPRLGAPMPIGSSMIAVVHKGRLLCSHWIQAGGVKYDFDVECGSVIVVYVNTYDSRFRTSEGIAIGDRLGKALSIEGSRLEIEGSGCGVLLPSGWLARSARSLDQAGSCDGLLDDSIAFFDTPFKRSSPK